ncbi:sodium-dependent bicarbonate transport family permease [Pontivivens ytuae]|uniref:Sodium-dependent bicarbonate transport family permease n=1 Tax=Pontivivens ytuae TaxID=2789856 RepID=A0A7S9QDS7_9RHOB|nr:sodium-dependent bicarbonate transport family permease [Pontivivens ytuae]QPH55205.1 sodium-dependent bicarbonate transport family permease [Pontivivens ytuae]
MDLLALAAANLTSPVVLFFALGFAAAMARSDLVVPEAVAKGISLYLLLAIGFKGGVGVAANGLDLRLGLTLLAGAVLSFAIPFIAFALLKAMTRLSVTDAAAVAAHYGSISIVTFVAMTSLLDGSGIPFEGYMVAVAAVMEAPAIFSALLIAARTGSGRAVDGELLREVALNGSIVLLTGAFLIGWATGAEGFERIAPFIEAPFQGVLCFFLLDMGLIAARGLRGAAKQLNAGLVAFGVLMPLIGATLGIATATLLGLSVGGTAVLATLAASASYIAVPAAMRVAMPEANPGIYLTMSLGVTFPFNLTVGLAIYLAAAQMIGG